MAAVRHLLCVGNIFWNHLQRVFGGFYVCAKFGWSSFSSFDNTQVSICRLARLAWKRLIYASKLGFLEKLTRKWRAVSTRPPKGTSLWSLIFVSCFQARVVCIGLATSVLKSQVLLLEVRSPLSDGGAVLRMDSADRRSASTSIFFHRAKCFRL